MSSNIECSVVVARYLSKGFFRRVYISFQAAFNQKDVNHVTGDIHFITFFMRKRTTVLTIHDVGFMGNSNTIKRSFLKWFWIILPVKRSGIVTTVSIATRNELLKYVSIDANKIKVIYNPISPLFVSHPKVFNKEKPTILQIGTKHNKNILRLVQALNGISCRLEIIGEVDGLLLSELVNNKIDFVLSSELSSMEVVEKYKNADILAFVSTQEGFGLPIIEANAIGRVVITSNIFSMPEVAGDAAHFVDPFNVASIREGFVKVINDDLYRDGLISRGLLNCVRFDVSEIASQYEKVYKELAGFE